MKIVETVILINAAKTIAGHKDLKLILDTDTGRLSIDTPAMFADPIIQMEELQDALNNLAVHMERSNG